MLTATILDGWAYCGRPGCGEPLARIARPRVPEEIAAVAGPQDEWQLTSRTLRASGIFPRGRRPYRGEGDLGRGPIGGRWPLDVVLRVRCPRCRAVQVLQAAAQPPTL
jgi:hypothetical protein